MAVSVKPISPTATPADAAAQAEPLAQAYARFSDVSDQLAQSHALLEQQVSMLKRQLAEAEAQRVHELAEKARLAGRLQNVLDLLPGGVVLLDGRGVVREANPAARELLGEPLEGELWRDLIRDRFAPREDDYHEVSLRSGRRVSLATRSLVGEPGQLILLNDLTETRELQSQLARNERLSALGRMVASLAHQIRTPLSAALLYAEHLNDEALAPVHRVRFADRLQGRLHSIEHQIRDMLQFAKGDLPIEDRLPASIFFEWLQSHADSLIDEKGGQCRWESLLPADVMLRCNRDTLAGAVINLIDNALQAGAPQPNLKVCMRLIEGQLSISVVDNGSGMSAEQLTRIGEPFHTTRAQGTGLGVAVVKSVVQAHGGQFALRSKAGWGTCAEVILPVRAMPVEEWEAV
ncbi:sensor histidine kinase [Halopseudomonas sp.]|uniref:sensor histidine kinase n=1 Tax=Halopseudomonas sp. TaxID=2901191 RepID=UPI00300148C6